jgi:hypothetical protein
MSDCSLLVASEGNINKVKVTVLLRNNLTLRSRSERVPNAFQTRSERGRNAVGMRSERGWNAVGTRLERVPVETWKRVPHFG